MKREFPAAFQPVLERFLDCGPIKAWSLIVTILGDLAANEGARVPGPVLSRLTEPMGVRPEALRVAIHRLRRDGWITSERDGRTSLYGLTEHGRTLTRSVSHRVYGGAPDLPGKWRVIVAPSAEALQAVDHAEFLPISPRTGLLADTEADLPAGIFAWVAEPGDVPDWAQATLIGESVNAAYASLLEVLEEASQLELSGGETLDLAVLRLAALHQWRRLVLRHGAAAEALLGPDWIGARCRLRATQFLADLEQPKASLMGDSPTG